MAGKKILLVIPRMNIGGAESHVFQIAKALHEEGWQVEVASGGGSLANELRKVGIHNHWLPIRWGRSLARIILRRILKMGCYDLVHAHSNATGLVVSTVCDELNIPWIYTAHTGLRPPQIECFGSASRILAVSDFARRIVLERGKDFLDPKRVLTLHNAIDCNYFSPQGIGGKIRSQLGIKEDEYVIGIIARLRKPKRKGHDALVRVLALPEAKKWRLLIIGKAHWWYGGTQKILRLAKKIGVSQRLVWSGHQLDVRPYIEACDVIALPSWSESFGLALAEAMAMEKPVVAYDGSGTEEVIGDNEGGILVPLRNECILFEALLKLTEDQLRWETGKQGRERIKKLYDLPGFLDRLIAIYEEVVREKGRTR